ncbi:unnamed protein product [Effrenium voratum]|nr:unnamed protein product [Effrenium voratum]
MFSDESVFETRLRRLADEALRTRMETEMKDALLQMEEQVRTFQGVVDRRLQERLSARTLGISAIWSSSPDRESLGIIQNLANAMVEELHSLMDVRLVRDHRQDLQQMVGLSKQLNNFRANKSDIVQQKFKAIVTQVLRDKLQATDKLMSGIDADGLLQLCKRVVPNLQQAADLVSQVPEMEAEYIKCCKGFCEVVLTLLPAALVDRARDMDEISELASKADSTLRPPVPRSKAWEPLAPRVKEMREAVALSIASSKLEQLQAVVAEDVDLSRAGTLLDDFMHLCRNPDEEQKAKLRGCMTKLVETVQSAFDQAIDCGDPAGMQRLLVCAKDLDEHEKKLFGAHAAAPIARSLEQRKAGVTLTSLLGNAERKVSKQTQELHQLYEDTEASFKRMDPEKLATPATNPRWRFRLGNGKFRDYSEEKSQEVEALYQAWCKKGKPTNKEECRQEITIQVVHPP